MNADTNRRLENLIRIGTIASVTPEQPFHTVTVNLGDIVTAPLRLLNMRAGTDKTHDLPSIGEECVVISPSGELALGIVICGLNNENFPTPSQNPDIKLRVFEDGAIISYDTKNHALQAILPSAGTALLTAKGGITINGDTTINGNLTTNGNVQTNGNTTMTGNNSVGGSQSVSGTSQSTGSISTSGDVSAGGISLKNHKHNGVKGGSDTSGGAV
ncbi:phage baseplate assembly protein V [Acinetobacter rathckeae]|uniref:phage baseplate assembly protein V n=1 Tax=Acinetobacter rathckeae TaxID=2605272 RepID=UPI0018A27403|nr:phage baseplate assembly protein V [Acinetobacter rathckeae]MBF7687742.1 phage baseplate assembly protein V [Acinetobacter rathckeae]MBF7688035.1 phage baseplate assembly protein V [Acinetobacter rathckeae]